MPGMQSIDAELEAEATRRIAGAIMHHFLAIDQGTSGTKAIVVDEAGHVVSIAEVAVRPEYLVGGGVEQTRKRCSTLSSTRPESPGAGRLFPSRPWPSPTRAKPCSPGTATPGAR